MLLRQAHTQAVKRVVLANVAGRPPGCRYYPLASGPGLAWRWQPIAGTPVPAGVPGLERIVGWCAQSCRGGGSPISRESAVPLSTRRTWPTLRPSFAAMACCVQGVPSSRP
jgi:hypothetical protein